MVMNFKALFMILCIVLPLVFTTNSLTKGSCPNLRNPLSSARKRRHLAFPTGAAANVIASVVKTFNTHVPSGWFVVVEAELIYKLPNEEMMAASLRKKLHHRQKRMAWELVQSALDGRNINGRACIIRTICDAKIHLAARGKSLVHDILRTLFTAPLHDEDFIEEIGGTYDELLQPKVCEKMYDCPFSLLKFILDLNKIK